MVAQMLMQPIQRATENLGGGPFGIGADAGGSYFVDPEVAARTGYGTAVTGTSFFPGAGIVDAYGGAVDITGQPLPSFSENIREGQFTDAGLQALGVAGDIATIAAPFTAGTSLALAAMLKAPGAARKVTKATDVASDVAGIAKVEPPTETQPGIIAFHGSGADFDEFKLEKIGTGEGAAAFGYGLYFTNNKDIGDFYKNALTRSVDIDGKPYIRGNTIRNTELLDPDIADDLGAENGNLEAAIKNSEEFLREMVQADNVAAIRQTSKELEKLKALRGRVTVNPTEGKTYKVAIQPKPEELLDIDILLTEQPKILEKLKNYEKFSDGDDEPFARAVKKVLTGDRNPITGQQYREPDAKGKTLSELFSYIEKTGNLTLGKKGSEYLQKLGIKGLKFKSGQLTPRKFISADEKQSENYVIFDDKIIKILEKYGIVGPVAVSATAAALKDDDGST